jgi:NAD(P)-dependent dehydrogenase (short-subunit alcohol dehydrogenase family)
VAIVTGAGQGIGKEIALRFAAEGCAVVVSDINSETIKGVKREIEGRGGRCLAVTADVAKSIDVQGMVQATLDQMGKVDILVNNAGVIRFSSLLDLTEEEWDWIYAVNVKGVFLCSKAVAVHMIGRKQGKIINIASIAGKTPGVGAPHYASSKAAVINLTQAVAKELAPYRVQVNAICPGFIETEMLAGMQEKQARGLGRSEEEVKKTYLDLCGWHRLGAPKDVADLAVFLATNEAEYITGQAINVSAIAELH